jgi:hypothetical protein
MRKCSRALIHHQGIICGVAFDRSSLRRIAPYASVVAPRRLTSNTLLVIRNTHNLLSVLIPKLNGGFGEGATVGEHPVLFLIDPLV